jgi:lactate dehydrogenase-like 2-hydroxyacid dehydrogenase
MVIQGPSAYKGNWFIGERLGDDPTNKVLGIVGFGRIGQSLAQKCRAAFNMEVCGRGGGELLARLYVSTIHGLILSPL